MEKTERNTWTGYLGDNMYKFLFLFMFFVSCAHTETEPPTSLKKYIEFFEEESMVKFPENYPVSFINGYGSDYSKVGACDSSGRITFSKTYWNSVSEARREMIFLHEVGHCLFGFDHNDTVDENGVPESLMNTFVSDKLEEAYRNNKDIYLDRLFPWRNQGFRGWGNFPFSE